MIMNQKTKNSNPVFTRIVTFKTDHAQKCYDRIFNRAAKSLFAIEVIFNIMSKQNKNINIDEIFSLSNSYINNTDKELNTVIKKINELLIKENNNVEEILKTLKYTNEKSYEVIVSSPKQIELLNLISKLDGFIQLIDIAWMSGILDSIQRAESVYQWRKKINGIGSRIIALEKNIRNTMIKDDQATINTFSEEQQNHLKKD